MDNRERDVRMSLLAVRREPVRNVLRSSNGMANAHRVVSFRSALIQAQKAYLPARSGRLAQKMEQEPKVLQDRLADVEKKTIKDSVSSLFSVNAVDRTPSSNNVGMVSKPMALSEFPKPEGDNGRGMHWVPITSTSNDVVDRFVKEAKEMKIKWMVILNDDAKIGANDYLVRQLVANGIMPIMRIYTPNGRPIQGDIEALVKHYRAMGVYYYQLYNEPNLNVENPDGVPNVDTYLDRWLPAAKKVVAAGGLPGLGALAPGGNYDDIEFLKQTLDKIKQRGEVPTLDKAWLSMHNYTLNHPIDYSKDSNGFLKFKWYDRIVREKLGRQMPIIGTEGGTHIGSADDKTFPPIDERMQVEMVTNAYRYMKNREPYNFVYTYWIIANEEGGGHDTAFSHQALFKKTGQSPVVAALKNLD